MAVLQTLVWALLVLLPLFYNIGAFAKPRFLLVTTWIPLFFYAVLFYINYYYLIGSYLLKSKSIRFVLCNLLLFVVLLVLMELTKHQFRDPSWPPMTPEFKKWIYIKTFFSMIVTLVVALSVRMTQKWLLYEHERSQKETELLKTELSMLRFQIQPHFFFNALNNIYSLIDVYPEKAKETVHGLGKLMRYLLYETNSDTVSLDKELEFIKNFVSLMKIRLSNKVKVIENYPDSFQLEGIKIAPLLFISLIENAFKHGVSAEYNSEIVLSIRVESSKVICVVQNNNYPKSAEDKGGSGVGMENLRYRILKLYPSKHDLFQQREGSLFTSTLIIET